ncbi:MAG: DNA-3-methyladenine glycosylase I [Bryobacteraceae bacterium]|nr:DNA-3-methyladenine glycosylase I [Bryobacteraceae bacterium]
MGQSYCAAVRQGMDEWNTRYHDEEYGFPLATDDELFERLVLEINQAGLSWLTILKKRDAFTRAYDGFAVTKVAAYGDEQRARLLADAGVIRNRLKVNAAIENARRIQALGSFGGWLEQRRGLDLAAWVKEFKRTFVFTGGEIVNEFLVSTGYLPGAHDHDCPVYRRLKKLN